MKGTDTSRWAATSWLLVCVVVGNAMDEFRSTVTPKELVQTEIAPVASRMTGDGTLFLDFGRAAYGTVVVPIPVDASRPSLAVHLGEKLNAAGRIDRDPPGTIRYCRIEQALEPGRRTCRIVIPPDKRNTGPVAIKMPAAVGEVVPFRYAEIEAGEGIDPEGVRQLAVHYPFNEDASAFDSSSEVLNAVWDICKHTIKATTFCGVYVDGDRERIPYEGDAYINQLGHYGVDREYEVARYSHEYMIQNPTWCTEWHLHSVMMAWMDYLYTGETTSIEAFYDALCAKTLMDFAREDGLISVAPELRTPAMSGRLEPHFASGIIKRNIRDVETATTVCRPAPTASRNRTPPSTAAGVATPSTCKVVAPGSRRGIPILAVMPSGISTVSAVGAPSPCVTETCTPPSGVGTFPETCAREPGCG